MLALSTALSLALGLEPAADVGVADSTRESSERSQGEAGEGGGPAEPLQCRDCPPAPRTGEGLIVGGAVTMSAGIPLTIAGVALSPALPLFLAIWVLPTAIVTSGGVTMLVYGVRRRARYRAWVHTHHGLELPPSGRGLMASGGLLVGFAVIPMGLGLAVAEEEDLAAYVVPAVAGFATGGTLLGLGIHRHLRYKRWRAQHPIASAFLHNMVVSPMSLGAGGGLMVSTRF